MNNDVFRLLYVGGYSKHFSTKHSLQSKHKRMFCGVQYLQNNTLHRTHLVFVGVFKRALGTLLLKVHRGMFFGTGFLQTNVELCKKKTLLLFVFDSGVASFITTDEQLQ